jgi:hypothetical protein
MSKKESIEVIPPGTQVLIGNGDDRITGTVLEVIIGFTGVQYKVVWWSGRERKEQWMQPLELLMTSPPEKFIIGFGGCNASS